jgi:hypothetical protein
MVQRHHITATAAGPRKPTHTARNNHGDVSPGGLAKGFSGLTYFLIRPYEANTE